MLHMSEEEFDRHLTKALYIAATRDYLDMVSGKEPEYFVAPEIQIKLLVMLRDPNCFLYDYI